MKRKSLRVGSPSVVVATTEILGKLSFQYLEVRLQTVASGNDGIRRDIESKLRGAAMRRFATLEPILIARTSLGLPIAGSLTAVKRF
jgi:hypothetical protein